MNLIWVKCIFKQKLEFKIFEIFIIQMGPINLISQYGSKIEVRIKKIYKFFKLFN